MALHHHTPAQRKRIIKEAKAKARPPKQRPTKPPQRKQGRKK